MKVGDEVIIDPYITDGSKLKEGIFEIKKVISSNVFLLDNGLQYHKDCLILADPFEVGDVVTIRQDIDKGIFPHGFTDEMNGLLGKEVTILAKYEEKYYNETPGVGKYYYSLKEDTNKFSWPLCAFGKIIKKSKHESRLQKQDSSFDRRSGEGGIRVRSRKHRARVEVSSLKYQKVLGRG